MGEVQKMNDSQKKFDNKLHIQHGAKATGHCLSAVKGEISSEWATLCVKLPGFTGTTEVAPQFQIPPSSASRSGPSRHPAH
jgi:hypothetical protein